MKNSKKFDYFQSLVNMSEYALEGAQLLKKVLDNFKPEELDTHRIAMHDLEHKCDMVKHDLTSALVKEFLPPIDREDLSNIAHVTDNLTDCVENVLVFMYMANITKLRGDLSEFTDLVIECCKGTVEMLKEFHNFKKSKKLRDHIILLNDLEEKGDRLYVEAVHNLSCTSNDAREIFEWRNLYRYFENCFDAAESIADNIEDVIMKNA